MDETSNPGTSTASGKPRARRPDPDDSWQRALLAFAVALGVIILRALDALVSRFVGPK